MEWLVPVLLRWIHLVSAIAWIGGTLFIALVLVPASRALPDEPRRRLVRASGRRFRTVSWAAIGLLLATGLLTLWIRPFFLYLPRFHAKLGLVVVALGLSVLHDFVLGPRAGIPGSRPSARVIASWVARVNVLVVLGIAFLAAALRV